MVMSLWPRFGPPSRLRGFCNCFSVQEHFYDFVPSKSTKLSVKMKGIVRQLHRFKKYISLKCAKSSKIFFIQLTKMPGFPVAKV